jgi:hypothetical protein
VTSVNKKQIILFCVLSTLAILLVLLLNGKREVNLTGDKPVDFVYAMENLDASVNFGNKKESLKYFKVLLNTQNMLIRRAEELYKSGMVNDEIVKYLMANDPKFMLLNGTSKEREIALKILNLINGEKR